MKSNKLYVVTSWDDVTKLDLRISNLLDAYKLRGTFFVIFNWLGKEILADDIIHMSERHEIGAHTMNHVTLTQVSRDVARREISESKGLLETLIEKPVTSFAYPKGIYDKIHVEMVKSANYLCARTTKPFYVFPTNPYETNVTISAYPLAFRDLRGLFRLMKISKSFLTNPMLIKKWNELGKQIFDILLESGGVFHVFGHAWQVQEIGGWEKLEDLFAHIAFRKNVKYVTMTEFAESCFFER